MSSTPDILAVSAAEIEDEIGGPVDAVMLSMVSPGPVQLESATSLATLQPISPKLDIVTGAGISSEYINTSEGNVAHLASAELPNDANTVYFLSEPPPESASGSAQSEFQSCSASFEHIVSGAEDTADTSSTLPFPCDLCGESFHDGLALAVHQRCHGNNDSNGLDCGSCGQSFVFLSAFQRHHRRHVISAATKFSQPSHTNSSTSNATEGRAKRTRRPPRRFVEDTVTCGVCGQSLRSEEVSSHLSPPANPGYYKCDECDAVFGQRCSLTHHACSWSLNGEQRRRSKRRRVTVKRSEEKVTTEVEDEEWKDDDSYHKDSDDDDYVPFSSGKSTQDGGQRSGVISETLTESVTFETTGEGGALNCTECQITFVSRRNLLRHKEAQHGSSRQRFQCEECTSHFSRLDTLVSHSVEVHGQKRQFRCSLCARKFTQKRIVTYHLQRHTEKTPRRPQTRSRNGQTADGEESGAGEEAENSDRVDDPGDSEKSQESTTQDASIDAGRVETPAMLQRLTSRGTMVVRPVRYTCNACDVGFETRRRFVRHRQTDHGDALPQYACEECPATYSRIDELTRHTVVVHNQKRTHKCSRCTRVFTQRRIAEYHARGHDTKRVYVRQPKPYECEACRKSFATEDERAKHACRASKPSSKTCICDICGREISCAQALRRHRLLHSDERPAKCTSPGCNMAFVDDKGLAKHMVTHSTEKPYLCDLCGKSFAMREYLNRHTRFHTGERPFKCSACDKSFALLDTLNRHFLIHTGEKPYACEVCARPFRQAQQLKTHMKTHFPPANFPQAQRSQDVEVVVLELADTSGMGIENVVDVISAS